LSKLCRQQVILRLPAYIPTYTKPTRIIDDNVCAGYREESGRRSDTTAVTDVLDSGAFTEWTQADGAAPSGEYVPLERSSTTTTTSEMKDCFTAVSGRAQSVGGADNKNNCSAREAIVRSSQISTLLAAKTFRW